MQAAGREDNATEAAAERGGGEEMGKAAARKKRRDHAKEKALGAEILTSKAFARTVASQDLHRHEHHRSFRPCLRGP